MDMQGAHSLPLPPPVRDQEVAPNYILHDAGAHGSGVHLWHRSHAASMHAALARLVR